MSNELFVVYSYGAGEVLANTFNAISAMYTGGYMGKLFNISLMFGLIWAGLKAGVTREHSSHYVKWFMGYVLVILVLLQPIDVFKNKGMTMHIRDVITGKGYSVDHLPPGLVVPAGVISGIGYTSTKVFETLFSQPTSGYLPYHRYGTVFGAQVMSELRNITIQDAVLKENMESYITSCMLYDVMIGKKYDINELNNSSNIWKLLEDNSSGLRMFNYRHEKKGGRELLSCKVGLQRLASGFANEDELLAMKFPTLSSLASPQQGNKQNNQQVKKEFIKALEITGNFYGNLNGNASEQLRQILIINQFKDVPQSYGTIRAMQNQNTGWKIMGDLGQFSLPIMHSIFQALIYACFPIVITLLFFSQRYQSLKTYFELMVWIELWALLFAILNGAVSIFAKRAGTIGDITIASINNIATTQSTYTMMAYGLGLFIPSFAYMIAKGGVGQFVHMAGSLMASTQRGADIATGELTTGSRSLDNVSVGNRSFNNVSGNKEDTSGLVQMGFMRQRLADGAWQTDMLFKADGHSRVLQGGAGITTSASHINFQQVQSNTDNMLKKIGETKSIASSERVQAMESQQETYREAVDFIARESENIVKGEGYTIGMDSKESDTLMRIARNTEELQEKYNYDKRQAATMALNAELTGSVGSIVGKGAKWIEDKFKGKGISKAMGTVSKVMGGAGRSKKVGINLGMGGKVEADNTDTQSLSEGQNVAFSKDNQHVIDAISHYSKSQKYNELQSTEKANVENLTRSYDAYKQHQRSAEYHESEAQQIQESVDKIKSYSFLRSRDEFDEFLKYFASKLDPDRGYHRTIGLKQAWQYVSGNTERDREKLLWASEAYSKYRMALSYQRMPSMMQSFEEDYKTIEGGKSDFGSQAKSEIEGQRVSNENVTKARRENKDKLGSIDVDGSEIKSEVDMMLDKNREEVQQQKVDTKKEAQQIKDKVDEADSSLVLGTLRKLGVGEKNINKGKKYDE